MKVKVAKTVDNYEKLSVFIINHNNRHLFEKVHTQNGYVFLRKHRLSTVLYVDTSGVILNITGENPKQYKIGENIYK